MKHFAHTLLVSALSLALAPAGAQVLPSATGSRPSLSAGALFTYTQPDSDLTSTSTTTGFKTSENHLFGIGAFVDYRMSRWLQLEAEARWQSWNQMQDYTVSENLYAIGVREPIHTFGRFVPYGKAMVGLGSLNSSGKSMTTTMPSLYILGGGMDYKLTKRISLRGDFEYQLWQVSATPPPHPYTAGIGFSYKIF